MRVPDINSCSEYDNNTNCTTISSMSFHHNDDVSKLQNFVHDALHYKNEKSLNQVCNNTYNFSTDIAKYNENNHNEIAPNVYNQCTNEFHLNVDNRTQILTKNALHNVMDVFNENNIEKHIITHCPKEKETKEDLDKNNLRNSSYNNIKYRHCHFPRGIINPNYPGFQHLAHTLTEHYDSAMYSDSGDSENSEYDMDISPDSGDETTELEKQTNELNSKLIENNSLLENMNAVLSFSDITSESQSTSTPDILLKTELEPINSIKIENRPDLLHGVSTHVLKNKMKEKNESPKEKCTLELPPTDIIGDFGKELEHEFGLLIKGYRSLINKNNEEYFESDSCSLNEVIDANLSQSSDKIVTKKYLGTINQIPNKSTDINKTNAKNCMKEITSSNGNNQIIKTEHVLFEKCSDLLTENYYEKNGLINHKYKKNSYDDRQLPPVGVDYKRCQQSLPRKIQSNKKNKSKTRDSRSCPKMNLVHRLLTNKTNLSKTKKNSKKYRNSEEEEIIQYQQLISDKEFILGRSKYLKMSSWAEYLKNSLNGREYKTTAELISQSSLDVFEAYKINHEIDFETLKKHFQMVKQIEKKRRNDREQICRRLAMGAEGQSANMPELSNRDQIQSNAECDLCSDSESHSSDSETCPKLSKSKFNKLNLNVFTEKNLKTERFENADHIITVASVENESDFFTKQAKLQIEARMALSQAKRMAALQMDIERQKQCRSPITNIIRCTLQQIGLENINGMRRVSRHMLTEVNVIQLELLAKSLHTHIQNFNEGLMQLLMKRDELRTFQDQLLSDIDEISRFIGVQESIRSRNQ